MLKIFVIIFVVVIILLLVRLFGAWMLRIDEIIALQKDQLEQSKQILKELIKQQSPD